MASVFLSHSDRDRAVTERVVARLRAAGFAALFIDFDPEYGILECPRFPGHRP